MDPFIILVFVFINNEEKFLGAGDARVFIAGDETFLAGVGEGETTFRGAGLDVRELGLM